jgi:hypothetical protein
VVTSNSIGSLALMEDFVSRFLKDLEHATSPTHSSLRVCLDEDFDIPITVDSSLKSYKVSSSLIDFLHHYFSTELFGEDIQIEFTEEDKNQSDFKAIFKYLFDVIYLATTYYYLFFNLPVNSLKVPDKFTAYKTESSSLFSFVESHTYFKVFVPLENCYVSFMYKNLEKSSVCFEKDKVYVVPFTLCNNISSFKGTHLVFNFSS